MASSAEPPGSGSDQAPALSLVPDVDASASDAQAAAGGASATTASARTLSSETTRPDTGTPDSGMSNDAPGKAPARSESAREERRSAGIPIWIVLLILIAMGLGLGWQARQAGQLEAQVAGLEAQLTQARAERAAYEAHLGTVRGAVHEMEARFQQLGSLVDADPLASPAPSPRGAAGSGTEAP